MSAPRVTIASHRILHRLTFFAEKRLETTFKKKNLEWRNENFYDNTLLLHLKQTNSRYKSISFMFLELCRPQTEILHQISYKIFDVYFFLSRSVVKKM